MRPYSDRALVIALNARVLTSFGGAKQQDCYPPILKADLQCCGWAAAGGAPQFTTRAGMS